MNKTFFEYKKIIFNMGLLSLVFLLPLQSRLILQQGMINGNASEYLTVSLYATDILLIVLFIGMLILAYARNSMCNYFQFSIFNFQSISNFKFSNFQTIPFLGSLFIVWSGLSIFWADNKMLAGQRFFWLLLAAGLAWLVVRYENKVQLVFWFVMGLMVSAWLGIWQFFAQYAFANKWLGLAEHKINTPGTSYLEITAANDQIIHWLRSYGSFDHPNIFGFAMALGLLLILWMIYENKIIKPVLAYLALISLSFGLFASLSRSAFLGLFIGLVIILFRVSLSKIWKPLLAVGLVFGVLACFYSKPLLARSDTGARLEQKSINERELYFQQGIAMIKKNSIIGVGVGNYISNLEKEESSKPAWAYQPVHNVFLLVWAELGIVAMLDLILLVIILGLWAWKKSAFLFALVASFLPALLVDHWLWDLHFGIIIFGFIVGIIAHERERI